MDKFEGFEVKRPLGRLWMERREMGFGFDGLLIDALVKHLALRTAMVAMVAAIFFLFFFVGLVMVG